MDWMLHDQTFCTWQAKTLGFAYLVRSQNWGLPEPDEAYCYREALDIQEQTIGMHTPVQLTQPQIAEAVRATNNRVQEIISRRPSAEGI